MKNKTKLGCHSGTKKEEVIAFIKSNKDKKIEVHYEENFIDTWGDDEIIVFDTSIDKQCKELLDLVENHYIHEIKLVP